MLVKVRRFWSGFAASLFWNLVLVLIVRGLELWFLLFRCVFSRLMRVGVLVWGVVP